MLDPNKGLRESLGRDEVVILHDANIEAVLLLLFALHLRGQFVLRTLDFQDLLDVCMAIDKYDCIASLSSWLDDWLSPWKTHLGQAGYENGLCIVWIAGDEATLERAIFHILFACTSNHSKKCLTSSGAVFDPHLPPRTAGT